MPGPVTRRQPLKGTGRVHWPVIMYTEMCMILTEPMCDMEEIERRAENVGNGSIRCKSHSFKIPKAPMYIHCVNL